MAEKRSDYSDEAHQPKSREAGDPLAELARLIGQNDPFADIGRPGAHKPLDTVRADDRPAPEWLARPAPADERRSKARTLTRGWPGRRSS